MLLLRLFFEFFKTGLFSVGGGLATLPFLSKMADATGWFTQAQLADMVAVSESTPGPIGVNMATYVGFTTAGVLGSVVATLGLITPSVIVILLIASFLRKFRESRYVNAAFAALRPASTGLIAASGLSLVVLTFYTGGMGSLLAGVNWKGVLLAAILVVLTRFVKKTQKLHPIVWILLSAAAGIAFGFAGV